MDITTFHYSDHIPYPPVKVDGKNPQYAAAILSNIGSCNSEMTAVSLYFYNSLSTITTYPNVSTGSILWKCGISISLVNLL